jgi:PqqD family protein of HPr-rel-A system
VHQAPTTNLVRLTSEQFVIRRLGDEVALYDLNSGKTHLLDSKLATVFDLLSASPKTIDALVAQTMQNGGFIQDDIEIFVDHALLQLQDIGLVDFAELP